MMEQGNDLLNLSVLPVDVVNATYLYLAEFDFFKYLYTLCFSRYDAGISESISYRSTILGLKKKDVGKRWNEFVKIFKCTDSGLTIRVTLEAPYVPFLKTITKVIAKDVGFKSCSLQTVGFAGGSNTCLISFSFNMDKDDLIMTQRGFKFTYPTKDVFRVYGIETPSFDFLSSTEFVNDHVRTILQLAFEIALRHNWQKGHQRKNGKFYPSKRPPSRITRFCYYAPYYDVASGRIMSGTSKSNMTEEEFKLLKPFIREYDKKILPNDNRDFTDHVYEIKSVVTLGEYNVEEDNYLIFRSPDDLEYPEEWEDKRNSSFGDTAVEEGFDYGEDGSEFFGSLHSSASGDRNPGNSAFQKPSDVLEREKNLKIEGLYIKSRQEVEKERKLRQEAERKSEEEQQRRLQAEKLREEEEKKRKEAEEKIEELMRQLEKQKKKDDV